MGLSDIAKKLPMRGWIMIGVSAAVAVGFVMVLMQLSSAPSYSTLLAGVNPAQTSKIVSALAAQGIPYQLQNSGTAVGVPAADVANARIALASADLLSPDQSNASLFTAGSLGESDFQQQVGYQVALEQQLQDTIEQVQGVSSATVQLVIPNPDSQLFTTSSPPTTAAVLISGGSSLSSSAISGIAALVAGSVQGLSINKVTITSDTGEQLWPTANGTGSSSAGVESADGAYDQGEEVALEGMLAQVLGPGKSSVIVSAALNENQQSTQSLNYVGKPIIAPSHTDTESLVNQGGGTSAATTATATTGATGNSNYVHKIVDQQDYVGKRITTTTVTPGTVESQSVSVLVPSTVSAPELASLTAAVKSAIAYKAGRDTVTVSRVAFAATPKTVATAAAASPTSNLMGMAKDAILGLGGIVFLFLMTRMLRRREREALAEPTWLRQFERPRSLIELEEESANEPVRVKRLRAPVNTAKVQVEDLVSREPDRVVAQVREWMADD